MNLNPGAISLFYSLQLLNFSQRNRWNRPETEIFFTSMFHHHLATECSITILLQNADQEFFKLTKHNKER
jgi:hypothetical protein